jgi:hypothetical protein
MARQPGLLDLNERYRALSVAGDPLERLAGAVELGHGPPARVGA